MTASRAQRISKTQKVLKKHFKGVAPPAERSLLEHLLYACCLENAKYEAADEAFARVGASFFDWNEVRVTTVAELAESMGALPDPQAAATRLKRSLQSVFEALYSYDLEFLKKQNLGKAIKELEKREGVSKFVVAYVTQSGLGGHSIPIDKGALDVLQIVGIISEAEAAKEQAPGLERAIPKSKGVEFGSQLHQLGADFFGSPFSPKVRSILTEIDPEAKSRFPKRGGKSSGEKEAAEEAPAKEAGGKSGKKKAAKTGTTKKKSAEKAPRAKAKNATGRTKKSTTKKLAKRKPR